jgi:hypothetical protein
MNPAIFEVLPHPKHLGDWMLKAGHGVPFDLWYGRKEYAVSYAEWVARGKSGSSTVMGVWLSAASSKRETG